MSHLATVTGIVLRNERPMGLATRLTNCNTTGRLTIGSISNPLAGKFSGHTRQKPKRHERSRNMCTLLIGQNISDQSEPCRSDLKTTWRQHHDSTANVHC